MKSLITLTAVSTLFTAMYMAPAATIITIISILVISDIQRATQPTIPAIQPATPITRADDAAAWDAIFEDPDPIEEPIILSYRDIQHEIKARYTASQRKKLGIKLNASRTVLESWL